MTISSERLTQLACRRTVCIVPPPPEERIELAQRAIKAEALLRECALSARAEWLEANDPQDGTDCVTPFDEYLY